MRNRYGDHVEFLAVYLREAHPIDGWRSQANDRAGILVAQPVDMAERRAVAQQSCQILQIRMPVVVDEMDDRVGRAYSAKPDRLYIIDSGGRVAYRGGPGPFGYNPAEMEQSLIMLLLDEMAQK
jgi:hypothetical protein